MPRSYWLSTNTSCINMTAGVEPTVISQLKCLSCCDLIGCLRYLRWITDLVSFISHLSRCDWIIDVLVGNVSVECISMIVSSGTTRGNLGPSYFLLVIKAVKLLKIVWFQ